LNALPLTAVSDSFGIPPFTISYTPSPLGLTPCISPADILRVECGIVRDYSNTPPYNDEPKFYHITAQLDLPQDIQEFALTVGPEESLGTVGGASLDKERALWKAAGEAAERYCLLPGGLPTTYVPFKSFAPEIALDPDSICAGVSQTKPNRHSFDMDWVLGFHVTEGRMTWIPSQLVFVPHLFRENEVIVRAPITTGAAASFTLEDALFRGLCEVIERDAFMVAWLRRLSLIRFIPNLNLFEKYEGALLRGTLEASLRYHLEPHFFLLPTGTPIFTVLCALWDSSGVGPAVTVGAKASWNLISSILGSLEEAHQLRPWLRRLYEETIVSKPASEPDNQLPRTLKERAILWLWSGSVQHLAEWLTACKDVVEICDLQKQRASISLGDLANAVEQQGGTVHGVDLSQKLPSPLRDAGLKVAKVIVPEYQPLYLTEELKDYSWQRLVSAETRLGVKALSSHDGLNTFPHPFL
jgi:ribosomal protein S12 methylthiotransferase accessory factor